MTTKKLKKFMFNKVAYYTDGGECIDLGSEGDFGHYRALNFTLYTDPTGTKELDSEEWPEDDDFYYKAAEVSESFLVEQDAWGYE